jgi:hypothetical protein
MWEHDSPYTYDLILYLRLIGATMCGLLIVKEKWSEKLLPYLPTFWHLTLLYCIPFTSTVMFLLTHGSVEWLINVAMTIMFLIVLVDWVSFIILTGLGIALGFLFYRAAIGPINIQLDFSAGYLLVYQGIFATLIGLIFARRKQQSIDKEQKRLLNKDKESQASLLQASEEKLKAMQTLQSTEVQKLLKVAKDLQGLPVEGEVAEKLHAIEATLIPMVFQLQGIDTRAQDYLRLKVDAVPIKDWLNTVQAELRDKGLRQPIRFQKTTQYQDLVGDAKQLATLLVKSIVALQEQAPGNHEEEELPLLVGLEDTTLHYRVPDVEKDYIKEVKALRIVVTTEDTCLH